MENLETLAATVAEDLEHDRAGARAAEPGAVAAADERRVATALLRWVATRGLDGDALVQGWELGVHSQRGTDGVGGLLDRLSAAEQEAWRAVETRAPLSALPAEHALALHSRVRAAARILTRTALKGFIVGREQSHRRWLRDLRHDLRNPIGAIKNALSLLEETGGGAQPVERLCGIASRNATALEGLVRSRAADEADRGAVEWAGRAPVSMVVDRVIGDIVATAPEAAARLATTRRLPSTAVDALALEVALHAIARHLLASCGGLTIADGSDDGTVAPERVLLRVAPATLPADQATSPSVTGAGRRSYPPLLALARAVATGVGGQLSTAPAGTGLLLSFPALAYGEEGHDLRGGGQREDRQPGAL